MNNIKPINLEEFIKKNQPPKYELKERPKDRYNRIPVNSPTPRYGRENASIFYSADSLNLRDYQERREKRPYSSGTDRAYESESLYKKTRKYAA